MAAALLLTAGASLLSMGSPTSAAPARPAPAPAQAPAQAPASGPAETADCPTPDPALKELAAQRGISVGTAYRPAYATDDPCYEAAAAAMFDSLTPELATFTNAVAPEPGRFDLAPVDEVCDRAEADGLTCQAHALVWDPVDHPEWGIVPAWIHELPPAERRALMVDLITEVGTHLRGRVTHTTVANEVFDAAGDLQPTVWNTTGDDSYLFDAFRAARRADPGSILLYNDFGAEDVNAKSDAILDLATRLRAETVSVEVDGTQRDLPLIDGVGFQAHVGTQPGLAPDPASVATNLARFADAGLVVRITELDVRMPVVDGVADPAAVERQQQLFDEFTTVCLEQPRCDGISFWGYTDAHSWITENPATFTGEGAAHLLDASYGAKPALAGVLDALTRSDRAPSAAPYDPEESGTDRPTGAALEDDDEGSGWVVPAALGVGVLAVAVVGSGAIRSRRRAVR